MHSFYTESIETRCIQREVSFCKAFKRLLECLKINSYTLNFLKAIIDMFLYEYSRKVWGGVRRRQEIEASILRLNSVASASSIPQICIM